MSELDAQTLIQGVVMSEILKRPNERKGLAVTPPFLEETEKKK